MPSTLGSVSFEELLARLTLSPPSTPCRTLLPKLQPSVDEILHTLSPTDAEVFRSVLAGVPLISHTPSFAKQYHPVPAEVSADPFLAASFAAMNQNALSSNTFFTRYAREEPMMFYATFAELPSLIIYGEPDRRDDLRYAARAALRWTVEELDYQMQLSVIVCDNKAWETFKPLVSYRLACAAALGPLIDLGPPPADILRDIYPVSGYWIYVIRKNASCLCIDYGPMTGN